MKPLHFILVLLYVWGVHCAPPAATPEASKDHDHDKEISSEDRIPANMNIADYYYSIFGKHLDYDYREPLLTFGETENNDIDDIESEVDQNPDGVLWNNGDSHSRVKRFILLPVNSTRGFFNATRRWAQQVRRMRMERRRLRYERRRQWRENRIGYLNQRAETLRRQAELLMQRNTQLAQRQQQNQQVTSYTLTRTRSVPTQKPENNNTFRITLGGGTSTTSKPSTTAPTSSSDSRVASPSNQIPVKQVPIPDSS